MLAKTSWILALGFLFTFAALWAIHGSPSWGDFTIAVAAALFATAGWSLGNRRRVRHS